MLETARLTDTARSWRPAAEVQTMLPFVSLPSTEGAGGRAAPQPVVYAFLPGALLLLPPIAAHDFCSRPAAREVHCFHGARAPTPPPPAAGAWPPARPAPASRAPWPEGASLQAELRWGRVERARGPPLTLPDALRRELRRAYGTYPRTDVRVTRRGGAFLLQAVPRVGEPEVRVERRAARRSDPGHSGDGSPASGPGARGRPRKSKGPS
ncbi:PREDICTED: translation initiation factor IF-2-like [Chinchilla lanigera]|uniref:translation initiation factor IF-2-like n=1 Tax=Chinchilla lanigera TaxID=34839 RepID=UPI000696597E|nr:PREDICTED: translation initiation factor IF-2-like [Chinchilla lanigera]